MRELLFLKPFPVQTIWGGDGLKSYFGYEDFPPQVGHAWVFNALEDSANIVLNGFHKGKTLYDLWQQAPELFDSQYDNFPLIISLIAPDDDLSLQVHPDDYHAQKYGYPHGKNEGWFFISTPEEYSIVFGHRARNREHLQKYIDTSLWHDLIKHKRVDKEDFVFIPAGLLHAIKKGAIVYEVQEPVDVTYRFYDYDRVDTDGNKRALHLEQATECLAYEELMELQTRQVALKFGTLEIVTCADTSFFRVYKLNNSDKGKFSVPGYGLATVIRGRGTVDSYSIKTGDNFLIPQGYGELELKGAVELLIATE